MKRVLKYAGQALIILAITLALDFALTATVFSGPQKALMEAQTANYRTYIAATPYHHDLIPNQQSMRVWGTVVYPWRTDKYGFRTGECAPGDAEKERPAVFVIGDSFVEALGSTFEASFPGLIACDAARQGKAAWNLGVASYSPAIYHLKIRAAAERLGVRPKSIYLFLDLSDIDDDANVYKIAADGAVTTPAPQGQAQAGLPFDLGEFLVKNFTSARLAYQLYLESTFSYSRSVGRPRARWTLDPALMDSWGKRGLEIAAQNLDKVVEICREWDCRLTLIVYPWPDNVMAGDKDSIQVKFWRHWAKRHGVRFVDGFAPFFREPAETALHKYYIPGDVHFTDAGNRLVFETVKQTVGEQW